MARSHAEIDWRTREVAPLMFTSCWRGIQMSGGSLLSVSPKNPGGAMPTTVKGWPWTSNEAPITLVSPA